MKVQEPNSAADAREAPAGTLTAPVSDTSEDGHQLQEARIAFRNRRRLARRSRTQSGGGRGVLTQAPEIAAQIVIDAVGGNRVSVNGAARLIPESRLQTERRASHHFGVTAWRLFMSNAIIPFKFENSDIRVIDREDGPWFVLADICRVLEIGNASQAAGRLDEDEQNTVCLTDGIRGNPNFTIVSESGFYNLVMRSDKPQAKPFRKWVTSVVLPAIRKTGSYSAHALTPGEQLLASVQLSVDLERRTAAIEARQETISSQTTAVAQDVQEIKETLASFEPGEERLYTVAHYFSLWGWELPNNTLSQLGKHASRLCRERDITREFVSNKQHGKVYLYPAHIVGEVYDEFCELVSRSGFKDGEQLGLKSR